MVELFNNRYKIKSSRLKHWDYSSCGGYYITICTKDRKCFFGDIVNGKMVLSNMGEIAHKYWNELPKHFDNVSLDEYVVMPNHIHGIVVIDFEYNYATRRDAINRVSTIGGFAKCKNPMIIRSLSTYIRWFKGRCSYEINKSMKNSHFQWQSRFYEHIIRNDSDLNRIREYIMNNPLQWEFDNEDPTHINFI